MRGVWKMEETSGELLASLERTADYSPFLERVTSEGRRREYLASRVLLKALLGEEVEVAYRPSGAPFLPALPLRISISHTRGYAAVIVDEHPTGIDIEYHSDRVLKIRSRFLCPEEESRIDPHREVEHLLIHWCAKETLYKLYSADHLALSEMRLLSIYGDDGNGVITAENLRRNTSLRLKYKVVNGFVIVNAAL